MSDKIESLSSSCETSEKLAEYLKSKAEHHKCYKYYSSKAHIETIVNNNEIYLSDGSNWNDNLDKDTISDIAKKGNKKLFVLCLSFSQSENVAMWMLYSGNDGCMINYNRKVIEEILNSKSISLGKFKNEKFIEMKTITSGYKIYISDVLYYGESKNSDDFTNYYIRRSGETREAVDKAVVDGLTYQKKTLPWMYENECRIVVEVTDKIIIDAVNKDDINTASIKINLAGKISLKGMVFSSPNCSDEKEEYKASKLKGKISWDLCSKCKNNNLT